MSGARHRRKGCRPEQAIQAAIFEHIAWRGVPGLVAWHTPNGGARRPVEAKIFKTLGVRAGVSDLIAVHDAKIYALEIKAPGGRPTTSQLEFIAAMEAAGAYCCIAEGLDRALAVLEQWGLLRGAAS
jgi:hypothetical protein